MENKPQRHPLIGAGVSFATSDGYVEYQGVIVDIIPSGGSAGDLALVEYFDGLTRAPAHRGLVKLSEMAASERWRLYPSADAIPQTVPS